MLERYTPNESPLLEHLLVSSDIHFWDAVIVGDGSGNGWNFPCGWASVLVDKQSGLRKLFYGGANTGSVNFAELMPYYQALCWYHNEVGHQLLKQKSPLDIHIITDSANTALHGNITTMKKNELPDPKIPQRMLWAGMKDLVKTGYRIKFYWMRRMTSELNAVSDLIAGLSREAVKDLESVHQTDPDEVRKIFAETLILKPDDIDKIYSANPIQ